MRLFRSVVGGDVSTEGFLCHMLRIDTARLDDRAEITSEGWIKDTPVLTRAGVFHYRRADGTVRKELRPAEWVFEASHLESARGVPITVDHPRQLAVTSDDTPATIGAVLTAGVRHDSAVRGDVVVYNPKAIGRRREISLGYTITRLDETPGVSADGEKYDAIQVGPYRINHAALVTKGRAGPTARLRLDADDAVLSEDTMPALEITPSSDPEQPENKEKPVPAEPKMATVRLDTGLAYEAVPEVAAAFESQRGALSAEKRRADEAIASEKRRADEAIQAEKAASTDAISAEKRRADGLEAERDTLKAAVDKHDAALAKARADAVSEVKARLVLEADAGKHGVEARADMSDRAIREAVVNKLAPDTYRFDGRSDDYVSAAFDLATAAAEKAKDTAAQNRVAATGGAAPRADSAAPAANGVVRSSAEYAARLRAVGR